MRHTIEISTLTRTIYLFGAVGRGPYGFMTFKPDGRIETYKHPNESFYQVSQDKLHILDERKNVSSSLIYSQCVSGRFSSSDHFNHFLEPIFTLPPALDASNDRPPILVNTVPKSGTYLVAEALKISGYNDIRLHVSSDFLHDNRLVSDEKIHWQPEDREIAVPASAVASILRNGEFVVGHVDNHEQLLNIKANGCELINVVRNPFDQILSMMKFKLRKVKPKPSDTVWHSMRGVDQLKAFIISHPVDYWLNFSKMLSDNFSVLRFEDIRNGKVAGSGLDPRLEALLASGLKEAIGQQTSTLLAQTPEHWLDMFNDTSVKSYLASLGFENYRKELWPTE